jgi:hypothetical protein
MLQEGPIRENERLMDKVFGIGWAKTGTKTLGECLGILGYRHCSQRLDMVDCLCNGNMARIIEESRRFDSFEDWPWLLLYREMDREYPGARFVLTTRDESSWARSYLNMVKNIGEDEHLDRIRSFLYGLPFPHVTEAQLRDRYRRHNRDVMEYFAGRSADLLIVDWEKGGGWRELCRFLDRPVPDQPLPCANKGAY